MVGMESISIDPLNPNSDQRVHASDHYALQLIMNFRTRAVSHRSALVILPTTNHWPSIDSYRQQYDPSLDRWPPHINLLWPFFDLTDCQDDREDILLPLRLLLCQCQSFDVEIDGIDSFTENHISFMRLNQQSTNRLTHLHEQLTQLFPQCSKNNRTTYNPHMAIGQFENAQQLNQAKSALSK